jgi:capsular exopolysaccharide synthesis family protein
MGHGHEQSQLLEYLDLLRKRGRSVLALAGLGLLAGSLATILQTPRYRARTSLDIQAPNSDVLKMTSGANQGGGDQNPAESYIQTEIKLLQSNFMLDRVVGRLKTRRASDSGSQPPAWRTALGLGRAGASWDELVEDTARHVKIRLLGLTRIVEVVCDSQDPRLAGQFCQMLAQEYIAQNLETRAQTTQNTSEWLGRQLEALKLRLAKSEGELQESAKATSLVYAGDRETLAQEKLRELQNELARAQAERVSKQSVYELSSSAPPDSLPMVLDNAHLREYQVRLEDLRRQLAELSSTLTPAHYKIGMVQRQIDQMQATVAKVRADILGRVRNEFESAERREALLNAAYQAQMSLVAEQAGRGVQYNMLKREVDSTRKIYETMLQRVEELSLASAMRASTIRVVDPATRPTEPFSPNWPINAGVGLACGLFLGVMRATILSRSERTLREPGEAPLHLEVRELGVIPSGRQRALKLMLTGAPRALAKAGQRLSRRLGTYEEVVGPTLDANPLGRRADYLELVGWHQRHSGISESFSGAMSSILLSRTGGNAPKVILLTSPELGDGKTTVGSNLAIALAKINLNVLLIDGDTRRPNLHRIFGLSNRNGLIDILESQEPIDQIPLEHLRTETGVPNLFVLPAGDNRHFETGRFHSTRTAELLNRLRGEFDVVLVDSPPMLHIADARVLGHLVDGVILVFRAGKTTVDLAVATCNCLREDGTPVLGTILNDWDPRGSRVYSDYYRSNTPYFEELQRPA